MSGRKNLLRYLVILALITALGWSVFQARLPVSAQDEIPELFSDTAVINAQPQGDVPLGVLRSRAAAVNAQSLQPLLTANERTLPGFPLRITLFEDAIYTANWQRVETSVTGGLTYVGVLAEDADSTVTLAYQDGIFLMNIDLPGAMYAIRPGAEGVSIIYQIDPASFPPEYEGDLALPKPDPLEAGQVEGTLVGDDDGTRIDVMVVYTQAALNHTGGVTNMTNTINLAVAETNTGYADSQITQRMSLVYSALVDYSEAGFNWSNTLNDLTFTGGTNAEMDNVQTLRNTYSADLVVLLVDDTGYCGIGWMLNDYFLDELGFTVVSIECATGYYTFAHEAGHNMGAFHDWGQTGEGYYPYSRGYYDLTAKFYTVMSYYPAGCSDCYRINHWSNPGVTHGGRATGVAAGQTYQADNHLTLNNTAIIVARFRDGPPPAAPSGLTATSPTGTTIHLSWVDNATKEDGFKIERKSVANPTWAQIGTVGANSSSYDDTAIVCGFTYTYRIAAYNGNGKLYSNESTLLSCQPFAPVLSVQSASVNLVYLTWADNNPAEKGYRIETSANNSTWSTLTTLPANTTAYTYVSPTCGSTAYFRIAAFNEAGSNTSSTQSLIPCQVTSPTGLSAVHQSMIRIHLSWSDNAVNETGFKIERKLTGSGDWVEIAAAPANATSFSDASLACGTSYDYRVRAVNAVGSSLYSITATTVTDPCSTPPTPSTIAVYHHGSGTLLVMWENVDGEDGFYLQRSENQIDWVDIAATGKDVAWYLDAGLTDDAMYTYRVRAFKTGFADSSPSPTASEDPSPHVVYLSVIVIP
jgi:hypothetical protein